MVDTKIKVREFKSLDDFRTWWESPEVEKFCQSHPSKVALLKSHRWVAPWITKHTQSEGEEVKQPAGKSFGKYIIEKKLGQGGMGAVYLAHDPALNRKVALKVMLLKGAEATERFSREAKASAKLKHPNIISVYDIGTAGKYNYFTMEYIEGVSLDDLIARKILTPKRAAEIIKDIAGALHYAHTQGIIHRDIKPANILIDKQEKVYLTDFGLAKELSGTEHSLTMTGTIMGTADYMSPEQAQGIKNRIDQNSDIFSLGATLYHALTGFTPFRGKELYQILERVVHKDPIPPTRLVRNLSKDIETICLKCLEKEKIRRYKTAAELAGDLQHFINGEIISARPVGFVTKAIRKSKQNKIASIAMAGTALILLAILAWSWRSGVATNRQIAEKHESAAAALEARDYDRAIVLLSEILAKAPDDRLAPKLLADARQKKKSLDNQAQQERIGIERNARVEKLKTQALNSSNPQEKINLAQEILKIDPSIGEAYEIIGDVYVSRDDDAKALEYFTKAIELTPSLSRSHYRRGILIFRHKGTKEAVPDFENAVKYSPDSYEGHNAIGYILVSQNNYAGAIDAFTRALEKKPNDPSTYLNRGVAYYNKGDIEQAIADYTRSIKEAPGHKEPYVNRGGAYHEKKEFDKAIADYTKAIGFSPNEAELYRRRAFSYGEKDDLDNALADYTRALELEPNDWDTYIKRGIIRYRKRDINGALDDCKKAIELKPDEAMVYANCGLIYVEQEQYEDAIKYYNKASALKLTLNARSCYLLGLAYANTKDYQNALKTLKEALRLKPDFAEALVCLGDVYVNTKDYQKAIESYKEAISLKANLPEAHNNIGIAYINTEDYRQAIESCHEAIRLKPGYAEAYYNLGVAYVKSGDNNKAIEPLKESVRLKPDYPEAYMNLGSAYLSTGGYQKAVESFKEAIRFNPDIPEAYYNIACAYSLMKDREKAIEYLKKAVENGYRNKEYISKDKDLDFIRPTKEYKDIIKKLD